jgi:hypothetical protein
MNKFYCPVIIILIVASLFSGCTVEEQISKTINSFIEAYNERDAQKCLGLCSMGESEKEEQLNEYNPESLQRFFNIYPSTPTIASIEINQIGYIDEMAIVFTEFYSVDYDSNNYYNGYTVGHSIKANALGDSYPSKFALTETNQGIFGLYSTWKVYDIQGIPGIGLGNIFH